MAIIYLGRLLPNDSSDSTRKVPRAASSLPYLVLLRVGFIKPPGYPDAGTLLPHLSTLACVNAGGFRFYDTFPEVALAGRYPAHCPVEPGLSSCSSYVCQRLPFMLAKKIILAPPQRVKISRFRKNHALYRPLQPQFCLLILRLTETQGCLRLDAPLQSALRQ